MSMNVLRLPGEHYIANFVMFAHDSSSNIALLFIWNPYPLFLVELGRQHSSTATPSEDVEEPISERVSRLFLFIIREVVKH